MLTQLYAYASTIQSQHLLRTLLWSLVLEGFQFMLWVKSPWNWFHLTLLQVIIAEAQQPWYGIIPTLMPCKLCSPSVQIAWVEV